jgi:hypothetical protein
MIFHILRMYDYKHPRTWDEILPYVQHSYNKSLHNSIVHNPFKVCLGSQPLAPIEVTLPIVVAQEESSHTQIEADWETKFVDCIQHIQQRVPDIVQKSNSRYKQCHNQYPVPHKFQVGDKVWLHLQKECLTGPHQKLCSLRYRPYTITKTVGENSFELSIPPFLGLHPVFNVELLRPYFPPLLDTSDPSK